MEQTNRVFAHKEGNPLVKTSFTRLVWDGMGKNKNGWVETSASNPVAAASGKADVDTEAAYRKLYEQGKGFAADGKHTEALAKYEEAQKVKDSPYLKGVINKTRNSIAAAEQAGNRAELVANAATASAEGDFETAIDLLTSAQEMEETEEVAALLTEAQAKEEESLTN